MPLSVDQFVRRLVDSELFTRSELNDFVSAIEPRPQDGEALARELVRAEKLTRYQVKRAYAGEGGPLVLGNYAILEKIGAGGMGEVYLAEHRRMGRKAALKILPARVADDQQAVRRFHREVQAVARLSHPNIVAAFDAGESKGTHYFVMEYAAGEDLSSIVKANGPLAVDDAIECIQQSATGLAYAHEQGVIHRDIKPSNLLLASIGRQPADHVDQQSMPSAGLRPMLANGIVKVLDLGLARFEQGEHDQTQTELTGTGAVMGTVDYMAPEQAMNTKNADARSDIYSLGCALFYLLTGRAPYTGETVIEKIFAHQNAPIPSLNEASIGRQPADGVDEPTAQSAGLRPMLAQVQPIFEKMVAKQAGDRFQSMNEIVAVLKQVKAGAMATATADTTTGTDLELRQFLDGINQPETQTFAETPAEQPPPKAAETEATVSVPEETITSGLGSMTLGLTKRPKKTWRDYLYDRNVQIFGGGALLVLVAAIVAGAIFAGGDGDNRDQQTENQQVDRNDDDDDKSPASDFALSFAGRSNRVTIPSLKLSKLDPVTVEAWVDQPTASTRQTVFTLLGPAGRIKLGCDSDGRWYGEIYDNGQQRLTKVTGDSPVAPGKPLHVACVWSGSFLQLFVNGKRSVNASESWKASYPNPKSETQMGSYGSRESFRGVIDEVRVSGITRYIVDFTPSKRHKSDKNTLALYHCDDGKNSKLRDSSGNGHHGLIHGAKWVQADGTPIKSKSSAKDDLNRQVAEWAGRVGQTTLTIELKGTNRQFELKPEDPLPKEEFDIFIMTFHGPAKTSESDMRRLSGLRKLHSLVFSNADGDAIPFHAIPPQIASLNLYNMFLNDKHFAQIAKLKSLWRLRTNGSRQKVKADGFAQLKSLPKLTVLSIDDLKLENRSIETFSSLTTLQRLSLSNAGLTDDDVKRLSKLNGLIYLNVWANELTDASLNSIASLSNLTELNVANNPRITGKGLPALEKLTKLKILDLTGTGVKREEAVAFKTKHPSVDVVWGGKSIAASKPPSRKSLPNGWIFGQPRKLGPNANSAAQDSAAVMSADGLSQIFSSTRAGGLRKDECTVALFNFDTDDGRRLTDSSGNNHHGVIHDVTWVKP